MSRQRQKQRQQDLEWNFASFPTYYAFFGGMLLSFFLLVATPLGFFVFVASLFGVSFCTAHAFVRFMRNKTVDKRRQLAEEDERERRALAARAANALEGEATSPRRRRRRNRDR